MLDLLDPKKDSDSVVYVIANSGGYIAENNPDGYLKLFKDIKEKTKDKRNVYVVTGDVERTLFETTTGNRLGIDGRLQNRIRNSIANLGFSRVDKTKLRKLGVDNYNDAANKIYKLK